MKLITLSCSNCGSPIEARPDHRFLKCPFCEVHLKIEVHDDVIYMRLQQVLNQSADRLEQSAERLDSARTRLESNVEGLRAENALLELDANWKATRDELTTQFGIHRTVPTRTQAVMFSAIVTATVMLFVVSNPHPARWTALLVIPLAAMLSAVIWEKSDRFRKAYAEYVQRRRALLFQLHKIRGKSQGTVVL